MKRPRTEIPGERVAGLLLDHAEVWVVDSTSTHDGSTLHMGTEDEIRRDLLDWCGIEEWPAGWVLRRVGLRAADVRP